MPEQTQATDETNEMGGTGEMPDSGDDSTDTKQSPGADDLAGLKTALSSERDKRKTAERQAKRVKALETELEHLRDATRSDSEKQTAKAVAEAETKARAEARREMGARLVRAELRGEAAGKVADIDAVLDDLDLTRYLSEDGEPDARAIKAAVARFAKLAPADKPTPPFNGGARGSAPATDMNSLIRQRAGLS